MRFEVRSTVPMRATVSSLPVPKRLVSSMEKLVSFSPPERLKRQLVLVPEGRQIVINAVGRPRQQKLTLEHCD